MVATFSIVSIVGAAVTCSVLGLIYSVWPASGRDLLHSAHYNISILTWNVMQQDSSWSTQWGCPAEILRRDNFVSSGECSNNQEAEILLSKERFMRLSNALEEILHVYPQVKAIALQEIDNPSRYDFTLLDFWEPEKASWKLACASPGLAGPDEWQALFFDSYFLTLAGTADLEGSIPGCLALFNVTRESKCSATSPSEQTLVLASLHAKSGKIRNPSTVDASLAELEAIVNQFEAQYGNQHVDFAFVGDFNADIYSLAARLSSQGRKFRGLSTRNSSSVRTAFTSQHEHNWIAAYDGALATGLAIEGKATVIERGFMPKYLGGEEGIFGTSAFKYGNDSCLFPKCFSGDLKISASGEIPRVIGNSEAEEGLSDHLPVLLEFWSTEKDVQEKA